MSPHLVWSGLVATVRRKEWRSSDRNYRMQRQGSQSSACILNNST